MAFPDEREEDVGIKTRSGKKLNAKKPSTPVPAIQSTSNGIMLQTLNALAKWKKSSLCFNECTQNRCDPLGKFLKYNRDTTCKRCTVVRKLLQNELILIYDKEELQSTLINYLYFHVIKVFDADADQHYAQNRPLHPYFIAYNQFRELKKTLIANIISCFNVSLLLQNATLRPFIFRTKLRSNSELEGIWCRGASCEVGHLKRDVYLTNGMKLCSQSDDEFDEQTNELVVTRQHPPNFLVTISGRRYLRHNFTFAANELDNTEPQQFLLCIYHFRFFNSLYILTHMDWNVHLNFRHRVTQMFAQNAEMNAEQLINNIEPNVFSGSHLFQKLVNTYLPTIRLLNTNCTKDAAFSGKMAWLRFFLQLKNEAIFKKIARIAFGS